MRKIESGCVDSQKKIKSRGRVGGRFYFQNSPQYKYMYYNHAKLFSHNKILNLYRYITIIYAFQHISACIKNKY